MGIFSREKLNDMIRQVRAMKCLFALLITFFIAVLPLRGALIENGQGKATIVLPANPIPAETMAAQELSDHLFFITNVRLPIVRETQYDASSPMIAVGFNDRLSDELKEWRDKQFGEEELLIAHDQTNLLLAGGRPRGALYAVYEYLESLGVRWFTPRDTTLPTLSRIELPQLCAQTYQPRFRTRSSVFGNGVTAQWSARNRMNSVDQWSDLGDAYGMGMSQGPDFHTFWRMLSGDDFRRHPEWMAMQADGTRENFGGNRHYGVCLSNVELQKTLVERHLSWLRQNPTITYLFVGQNDGSIYCHCPQCEAFYAAHGNAPGSLVIDLVNRIARQVAVEFPQVRVKNIIYSWCLEPPENIRYEANVTGLFCMHEHGNEMNRTYTIQRDGGYAETLKLWERWKHVGDDFEILLYSYPTGSSWFPTPCLFSQARNVQWCATQPMVTGICQEVMGVGSGIGGDLVDLRAWCYARMQYRPESDMKQLVEEFCRGYYRSAASCVQAAIDQTSAAVETGRYPAGGVETSGFGVPNYVDQSLVRQLAHDLSSAYRRMPDDLEDKKRLGYAMLPFLWGAFWSEVDGVGVLDAQRSTWGIPLKDRATSAEYGRLIRQLMLENHVSAMALFQPLDPSSLNLEGMTRSYPACTLKNDQLSVVVVPECYGKVVQFENASGFRPLKSVWGAQITQYPSMGYGQEFFSGGMVEGFSVENANAERVMLNARSGAWKIQKEITLQDDSLRLQWTMIAEKAAGNANLLIIPFLDLNEVAFGLYPEAQIGLQSGGFQSLKLGKAGANWYQCGIFDTSDFSGVLRLISTNGKYGLEMKMDPRQIERVEYIYDRYDFPPKGTGRILEPKITTRSVALKQGEKMEFGLTMKLLDFTTGDHK